MSTSSGGTRCAACKYLRKRCPSDCIFSPYFPANDPKRFANVHRIYGASNIARMLQKLPVHLRAHAADSLYFEAQCRIEDPTYGCVKFISQLLDQVYAAESELARTQAEIAFHNTLFNNNNSTSIIQTDQEMQSSFTNQNGLESMFVQDGNGGGTLPLQLPPYDNNASFQGNGFV